MTVVTVPFRADIGPGESVDSWIEALARRHRIAPRRLLPGLGLPQRAQSTSKLIRQTLPETWRYVEEVGGLDPGRLDAATGRSLTGITELRSGGSRFCPACLAESGRWQLAWRLNWTVACQQHSLMLHDRCPRCGTVPRTSIAGGRAAVPQGTCTYVQSGRTRCGSDLSTAPMIPAQPLALAAQQWIEDLTAELGRSPDSEAAGVFADLPLVSCWLLLHDRIGLDSLAESLTSQPQHPAVSRGSGRLPNTDAALTVALLSRVQEILGKEDLQAIASLRQVVASTGKKVRTLPPGMAASNWKAMESRFPNRFLQAVDQYFAPIDRLRMKTVTPQAERPRERGAPRARMIPQLLWPDWAARLLPAAGRQPEHFRATISICLLLPGSQERRFTVLAAQLNHRIGTTRATAHLEPLASLRGPALTQTLTLLCRLADYLDHDGSAIDYQRRRESIPPWTLDWQQWKDLAFRTGIYPGDHPQQSRHLHAQRHLHHLLSGADLADRTHQLAFTSPADRNRYIDFTVTMGQGLRQALRQHALSVLTQLNIDEPLTWSPPPELADGLDCLPGVDTNALDIEVIRRIVQDERRPPGDAATALGVHIEHIRIAMERMDRAATPPLPVNWLRGQEAARKFTPEFFEREYVHGGRRLKEIAETSGFSRTLVARCAHEAGVHLARAREPFPVDPSWLREQYDAVLRSTSDIAQELGTTQMVINNALHRLGITPRPAGVHSFSQMTRRLPAGTPTDIRAAVEGGLGGWRRLRRFQVAMAFPTLGTAAAFLGAHGNTLVIQFRRLESDIGAVLFHRSTAAKRQHPTKHGRLLLAHLDQQAVQELMKAATDGNSPQGEREAAESAHNAFPWQRRPGPLAPFSDIAVGRLRMSVPMLTLIRDLLDHRDQEFYGAQILVRTGLDGGTLYPALKRLESSGWLASRPEDAHAWQSRASAGRGPGRRRIYYSLTPEGTRAAAHEIEWRAPPTPKKAKS